MQFVIVLFFTCFQICTSSVIFRIKSDNKNISIDSSYLFGTVHVAQGLIWPFLSNDSLQLLTESDEYWMEHDLTDFPISNYIYECGIDKMTPRQRTRMRAKTWRQFLNETKEKPMNESIKSNNLVQWRKWFANKESILSKYLWRNGTINNSIIFDHRIILEAYQRNKYVGSLESLPDDCFMIEKPSKIKKPQTQLSQQSLILLSRVYNCEMIDESFVRAITKNFDMIKMKKRNQQMTEQIQRLLTKDPHKKYIFAVGAAHLFGNISVVEMLNNDYHIERVYSPTPNFPPNLCTDEEFNRLLNVNTNTTQNKS